jgi:hypothetical protein
MDTYRGVRITDTYFTGHKVQIYSTLIRSISAICRLDRSVGLFYVGVASGPDYWTALTRRVDTKKLENGVTDMYLLYQSSSERNTRDLEAWLITHYQEFQEDDRIWNAVGGGGGRRGSGPYYFLYLAVTRGV